MKSYKILTVPLRTARQEPESAAEHPSLMQNLKDFFMPAELTDMDTLDAGTIHTADAEKLMADMNAKGWEVVSAVPLLTAADELLMFITFSREN